MNMPRDADDDRRMIDDPPPLFRSWAGVYAFVLGVLGFLVSLFYLFTRHYR